MSDEHTISYDEFGQRFVALAVSPERVASTIAAIAGDRLELGPLSAGPGDAATVTGTGRIGTPTVEPLPDREWLSFTASLPVSLDLEITVAGAPHRYAAGLTIPLGLTVRTAAPLNLVVDIEVPHARDIRVDLSADGLRAKILRKAGNVDHEVRRHAARFVRERVQAPAAGRATVIELLPLIDEAWNPQPS